jgi:DNA-binding transcriptional regulator YhcF (GntR family)
VEIKRGMGMYVAEGEAAQLLRLELQKFMTQEVPQFIKRATQLGITNDELCKTRQAHTIKPNK